MNSIENIERVNDIYLFVIDILIIVQDSSLVETVLPSIISLPSWFKEKSHVKVRFYYVFFVTLFYCFPFFS
jgi:hypothetical protein